MLSLFQQDLPTVLWLLDLKLFKIFGTPCLLAIRALQEGLPKKAEGPPAVLFPLAPPRGYTQ